MKTFTATLLCLTLAITTSAQSEKDSRPRLPDGQVRENDNKSINMREFDTNFAHTVFFWLKNPDNQADRTAFETSLQKFLDNSAYAKTKFIGMPPTASRDVVDGSFTYSLILSFESAEAQQKYQDEPPHKVFIEESEKLWTKVIVYDSKGIQN